MISRLIQYFLALSLLFGVQGIAWATELANDKLVFLVKIGTDNAENPLFRMADSSEARIRSIYDRLYLSDGVQRMINSHQQVESQNLAAQTPAGYHNLKKPQPLFVEIGTETGTFNEWKGNFSIQDSQGKVESYVHPRVVLDLNDSIFQSRDPSLVEQTVVHEIGHGVMRMAYGADQLPDSEWLGRPHYGDLVTDEQLAYIEGWSEFAGAYFTGRNTIAEDPPEAISQNAYAYQDSGSAKTPQDLMKTEGWVATVLLHIANHPDISKGYEKLVETMRSAKSQGLNELLRAYLQEHPEDGEAITEVLTRDSLNQISAPLGGPIASTRCDDSHNPLPLGDVKCHGNNILPPPVNQPSPGSAAPDAELERIFNDFQSSLTTYAQLRLDQAHPEWYPGAHPGEIQRRTSFQFSLVKSMESRLMATLQQNTGLQNQDRIAESLLDSLDKLRYEHNQTLQSYQKTNWWDQGAKQRMTHELQVYKELYNEVQTITEAVDSATLTHVWQQRQIRMEYRVRQNSTPAAPQSDCNAALNPDCQEAYNKLIGAIEANKRSKIAKDYLNKYTGVSQ
jgi:hypothetical protein